MSLRKLFRTGLGFAAAALFALAPSLAAAAPPLWAVKDENSTIYLFGTVHLLPEGTQWRTPAYDKAYAEAQAVWLETPVGESPEARQAMESLIVDYGYDFEHKLSKRLSRKDYARVTAALKPLGMDKKTLEGMRPWLAGLMITFSGYMEQGLSPEAGADQQIETASAETGKPLRYFETNEEQIRFFADLSPEAELQFLNDVLEEMDTGAEAAQAMTDAWVAGSESEMVALFVEAMRHERPELYEAILRGRNHRWAETLEREMRGEGVAIVNVGAAHMVGEDGLPALMKARGFTVERVQ
ncbi:MAG TPA: TraB/GumN family protein [Caulobacteraceae bacterium]|nr:TraB/GumN family protein [Caulobacteraceae bacterium]